MNMRIRTILIVSLTLIFANFDAPAQESASAIAFGPGYQRLTGEIKWKKTLGVPPTEPFGKTPAHNICQSFYVIALPPNSANNAPPVSTDTTLQRGPVIITALTFSPAH